MDFTFEGNQTVTADQFATKVPADFQPFYAEKDGSYVLRGEDPIVANAVKVIGGLNKSLKASRGEAQALKGKLPDLAKLADYGDSPDTILSAFESKLNEVREAGNSKTVKDVERQIEKIRTDLTTAHKGEVEKHTTTIAALRGQLHSLMVTSSAVTALSEANALDADLVLPYINSQVKVVEEQDGRLGVQVVDKQGDVRYSGTTGNPMTIKELVGEMKADAKYGPLFKSEAHTGGGGQPTRLPGGVPSGQPKTSRGKISHALETGQYKTGRKNA